MTKQKPIIQKTTFDNGLVLVSETHPSYHGVSMGIFVKTGTRYENPREAGICHFLEHMMFKGTENRSAYELVREIEQVGGDFNAYTTREYTCFQVLILSEYAELGAEILTDVLLNSTFDADEVERERKVILQEIAMVEDNPEELAFDLLYEKAYGRHGLGRPILGTETSVRRIKRRDLLRFYRKHYRPEEIVISVVGDIPHSKLKRYFKELQERAWQGRLKKRESRKEMGFEKAPHLKNKQWWLERDTEQTHVLLAFEGFRYRSRLRFPSQLLNTYLGGGMSSVLFQRIREENGLAYSVYSYLAPYYDSGMFTIYFGTAGSKVAHALTLIDELMTQICKKAVSEEELRAMKTNLTGNLLLSSDDVESRMATLATNEMFHYGPVPVENLCRQIQSVSAKEVRQAARRLYTGNRAALILGPKPPKTVASAIRGWIMA